MTGEIPYLGNIKIWGSLCYAHVPMAKRTPGSKIHGHRSLKCLLVGYQGRSNVYLVVPIDDRLQPVGKPFASTSVIFRETEFVTATYFPNRPPSSDTVGDTKPMNFDFLHPGKDDDDEYPYTDGQNENEEQPTENRNEPAIDLGADDSDRESVSEYADTNTPTQSRERG
ncbi:hypothetical protein HDU67_010286, partial [Dinochytrium kinnereticum]